jgi:hypothetical protein
MSTRSPLTPEGWGRPHGSLLRHYIARQRSLCGLWGYFGDVRTDVSTAGRCEACARAVNERLPTEGNRSLPGRSA